MVLINGFERSEKCKRCIEKNPELGDVCDGTDASCVNLEGYI